MYPDGIAVQVELFYEGVIAAAGCLSRQRAAAHVADHVDARAIHRHRTHVLAGSELAGPFLVAVGVVFPDPEVKGTVGIDIRAGKHAGCLADHIDACGIHRDGLGAFISGHGKLSRPQFGAAGIVLADKGGAAGTASVAESHLTRQSAVRHSDDVDAAGIRGNAVRVNIGPDSRGAEFANPLLVSFCVEFNHEALLIEALRLPGESTAGLSNRVDTVPARRHSKGEYRFSGPKLARPHFVAAGVVFSDERIRPAATAGLSGQRAYLAEEPCDVNAGGIYRCGGTLVPATAGAEFTLPSQFLRHGWNAKRRQNQNPKNPGNLHAHFLRC